MNTITDTVWLQLRDEAAAVSTREPALTELLKDCLLDRESLEDALSHRMARKLGHHAMTAAMLLDIFPNVFKEDSHIIEQVTHDIMAVKERDAACDDYLTPFLYFKGFIALQSYRMAHFMWTHDRKDMALYLQSIISEEFAVDIHPAAKIGCGVMIDHATSLVVGETAVIDNNVSLLHDVTLGGTGKEHGDRHPKVRAGVLISAGAKILGNVVIGEGAKVGAGSVVLNDVPPHTTVVGVPAEVVGVAREPSPALDMDHKIC